MEAHVYIILVLQLVRAGASFEIRSWEIACIDTGTVNSLPGRNLAEVTGTLGPGYEDRIGADVARAGGAAFNTAISYGGATV
jgi:hypothetical protein